MIILIMKSLFSSNHLVSYSTGLSTIEMNWNRFYVFSNNLVVLSASNMNLELRSLNTKFEILMSEKSSNDMIYRYMNKY